jgi:hypothetical protein
LRNIYSAADLPNLKHFFWFDSPFCAAGAAALLLAETDFIWKPMIDAMERNQVQREWLDGLRDQMCRVAGFSDWSTVVETSGLSVSPAQARPGSKGLQLPIVLARMSLYKDVTKSAPRLDDSEPVYVAERGFRAVVSGQGQWSQINPMLTGSFYQFVLYSMLARDEEELKGQAPPILSRSGGLPVGRGSGGPLRAL